VFLPQNLVDTREVAARKRAATSLLKGHSVIDFATGVGVNLTPEFYGQVMIDRAVPYDFLEVDPTVFDLSDDVRDTFLTVSRTYPIILHSTIMSLCGDAPFDLEELEKIAKFAEIVASPIYSDHLSFTWAGDINLDLYMSPIFNDEMLTWVRSRVASIETATSLPFIAENVGLMINQVGSQYSEVEFLKRLTLDVGVPLQLNLDSVSVSAATLGRSPVDYVQEFLFENIETIAVVPEGSMNPALRRSYGEGLDATTLGMLEVVLRGTDVDRVMVQRRSGDEDAGFNEFYNAARQIYASSRKRK